MSALSTLPSRMATYQAERFPLGRTAAMVAAFSSASVAVSARLAGRPLPSSGTFVVAFLVVLVLFYQMRACDELKDAADDARYRPERPVPRGLVSLREVVGIAVALAPPALLAALSLDVRVAGLLLLAWTWLALMTREFFVPDALRRMPVAYLVSHMLIMPLIDLLVTGCEWAPHGAPPRGLWAFLGLSFANGCVLEIGRKLWAPTNEREGVETYSGTWGPGTGAVAWACVACVAFALLCRTGHAEGAFAPVAAVGAVGLAAVLAVAARYARSPTPTNQSAVDAAAATWVLTCYLSVGFIPLLGGVR